MIAVPTAIVGAPAAAQPTPAGPRRPSTCRASPLASGGLFALVYGFSNAETHLLDGPGHDRRARAERRAAARRSSRSSGASSIRCCRCTSSGTGPAEARMRRSPWPARRYSPCSCSSPTTCSRTSDTRPLKTGLAFLPMTGMIVLTATTVQTRMLPRTGAKPLVVTGMTLGIIAMLLLTRLTPHGGLRQPRPAWPAAHRRWGWAASSRPRSRPPRSGSRATDAGIASAMVNTSQQVGGSVGTALLSTIFASAAATFVSAPRQDRRARQRGIDPRLHDRVRVGRRAVRTRTDRRTANPSLRWRQTRSCRPSRRAQRPHPQPRNDMTLPSAATVANPRRCARAQPKEDL